MNMLKSFIILFCATIVSQCATSKQTPMLVEAPFTVQNAYYQSWVAGMQEGGSGINVYLSIPDLDKNSTLETAYFKNMMTAITPQDEVYVAKFQNETPKGQDLTMSSDSAEEARNTPPLASQKSDFPFALADTEVGISFKENGVLKYTKISNLKEKQTIAYPSAPPRDRGW